MAGRLAPERLAYGFAALAGLIVLWNALAYPSGAGYDAASHKEYANFLIDQHRLPVRNETPEYYSPPLYYAIAGVLASLGRRLGLGDPFKLVQLLNVPVVVGTVLLAIALARLLWPERRWLPVYAAGFVALDPVLMRLGAMVNPEPTDLLVSTASLYLAARILLGRGPRLRDALWLGIALGVGEMIRQFALWTLAVVVLAFLAASWRRRELLVPLAVALAVCVAIALPWYVYRAQNYGNPVFDRPQSSKPLWERRPASFYLDPGVPGVFTQPYRPHLANRVWPQTYSDLWGDWYGVFAWPSKDERPSAARNAWLVFQNVLGLLPTGLAIGGWLVLLARRRALLVSLLPLAGLAGFLYFTVSFPTRDGDVIKPMYMLTTLGAWAICFACAADRLPRLRLALLAIALLDLPFVVYEGSAGWF